MKARSAQSRVVTPLLLPTLLGVAVAVTVAWVGFSPAWHSTPADAVYTVTYLSKQLTAHPAPWVGREVRMYAIAMVLPLWITSGTVPARSLVSLLADPGSGDSLPLVLGPQDRLLAVLRWLPVVGALAPPPQARVWGRPVVYRVQLVVMHIAGRDTYEAMLLDAA